MEVNISIDLKRDFDDDNSLLINQSMDDRRTSQDGIDYSKEVNLENRIGDLNFSKYYEVEYVKSQPYA